MQKCMECNPCFNKYAEPKLKSYVNLASTFMHFVSAVVDIG